MRERLNRRSVDMSVKQQLVTAEELWHMPKVPGMRFELIDGEVVKVSPASIRHGVIASAVHDAIKLHVRQQDLGLVMGDNVGYVLRHDPDHMRAPDVSFLAWDSVPEGDDLERFGQGPPTLAVEVVSPNDRANDIRERVQDYLEAGTHLVWVLWPRRNSISVYSPGADTRELGPDAVLDGGDVLTGFAVRVGDLFEVPRRRR
jgi:Uma2 family endonuclease